MDVSPPRRGRTAFVETLILVGLTFAVQANSLRAWFVGDDFDFLYMLGKRDRAVEVWSFSFWGEWEPLWHLSWFADQRLWGLNPLGYHLTNTAWFALCVVGLFFVVRGLWPDARGAAWAAALLFLIHPLHDEAVVYLAARGHPMALGLALVSLNAMIRRPRATDRSGQGVGLLLWAVAIAAALLAGLAKETALTLPAWVFVVEWLRASRRGLPALAIAGRRAAAFVVAACAVFVLRWLAVGLRSDKLTGGLDAPLETVGAFLPDMPVYALLIGLPFPFAFLDFPVVAAWSPLGWLVLLMAAALALRILLRATQSAGPLEKADVVQGLGLLIVVVGLFPILWADLSIRRRYGFMPSLGVALVACTWIEHLWARRPRVAAAVLIAVVTLGAAGTVWRNALWTGSGKAARSLYEHAQSLTPEQRERVDPVVLVTLPRSYGGDFLSGAYLLHGTDARSMMRLTGARQKGVHYALEADYAHDYRSRVRPTGEGEWDLDVSFKTGAAFRATRDREESGHRDHWIYAERRSIAHRSRRIRYKLNGLSVVDSRLLLLYSDGRFTPIDDAGAMLRGGEGERGEP